MEKNGKKGDVVKTSAERTMVQDFLRNDKWNNYLTMLSKATGFTLSMYTPDGVLLYSTSLIHPLCEAMQSFHGFNWRCDNACRRGLDASGGPKIFKCGAKIMNFTLPIEYRGIRTTVLGQGSFSRYSDLSAIMKDIDSSEPLHISALPMLPTFTSALQARNVCDLIESSIIDLLLTVPESTSFGTQRQVESMKSILEGWMGFTQMTLDAVYRYLFDNLTNFLEGRAFSVLLLDAEGEAFTRAISARNGESALMPASVSMHDLVVQRLLAGEKHVVAGDADLAPDRASDAKDGNVFFPVVVNGRIESLLIVAGPLPAENDIRVIYAFCRLTALAIENNRQHQELSRKFKRLASVASLTESIAPIHNEQTLLETILDKSAELLLAEQGSLMLLDQETESLLMEATKWDGDVFSNDTREKIRIPKGEGIAGLVAANGEPILVKNIESDPRVGKKNSARYKTTSFVSVPLKVEQRVMGVLNFTDKSSGEAFTEDDLNLAQAFASHAAVILERNTLSAQMDKLKKLSITDPLTGLLNRRYLRDRLEEEFARSQRYNRQMSILMVDLDGFKQYNDTLGHPAGDRVLETIAVIIIHSLRSMDIVARYGGDEFVVILPETGVETAMLIGERLRQDIAEAVLPTGDVMLMPGQRPPKITSSIGIACYPDHDDTTAEMLFQRADNALYAAKAKGRNRVEIFSH